MEAVSEAPAYCGPSVNRSWMSLDLKKRFCLGLRSTYAPGPADATWSAHGNLPAANCPCITCHSGGETASHSTISVVLKRVSWKLWQMGSVWKWQQLHRPRQVGALELHKLGQLRKA